MPILFSHGPQAPVERDSTITLAKTSEKRVLRLTFDWLSPGELAAERSPMLASTRKISLVSMAMDPRPCSQNESSSLRCVVMQQRLPLPSRQLRGEGVSICQPENKDQSQRRRQPMVCCQSRETAGGQRSVERMLCKAHCIGPGLSLFTGVSIMSLSYASTGVSIPSFPFSVIPLGTLASLNLSHLFPSRKKVNNRKKKAPHGEMSFAWGAM